jgi:hypothetical protein
MERLTDPGIDLSRVAPSAPQPLATRWFTALVSPPGDQGFSQSDGRPLGVLIT